MEFVLAFIISMLFGVIFYIPIRTLGTAGFTGLAGWTTFKVLDLYQSNLLAILVAAIVIGLLSEFFARVHKTPVTVFVVVGFIPLVPGLRAYNAVISFSEGRFDQGLQLAVETVFIACAIALGISIVSSIARIIKINFVKEKA
ncbi:uncharacterized membrane protein YjjB (DUF3815 family) [Desulfitispora alkaliphila]|uniref:threonine/serine exporter family protein n=1 Tax=Desulfitispora alkaliphila TaxID=622674 RepID=UPI003D1B829E